jgi:hypothetical protein
MCIYTYPLSLKLFYVIPCFAKVNVGASPLKNMLYLIGMIVKWNEVILKYLLSLHGHTYYIHRISINTVFASEFVPKCYAVCTEVSKSNVVFSNPEQNYNTILLTGAI